jgi:hypothetical protein
VYAAAKVLFELQDSYPTEGAVIGKGQEAAASPLLHRHLRHHGDSGPRSHHRQDGRELTARKDHIGLQPRALRRPPECFRESSTLP